MAELLSGSTVGGFLIALQNNDNNFQDITAAQIMLNSGKITSKIANQSSQIGFVLETPSYSTSGQKLISINNGTNEQFSIDKDGNIFVGKGISLNRNKKTSGISFYMPTYNQWQMYMQPCTTGNGYNSNVTQPTGSIVTSWALRSFIEGNSGYGWTWEKGSLSSTTPEIVSELGTNGNFRTIGDITAIKFIGSGESLTNIPWSSLTGKPTTLSGYGITDAVNTSDVVTTAAADKILKLDTNQKLPASITGNQETATKLQTQRTIQLAGQVTGSQSFDGSQNISITTAVNHNHDQNYLGINGGTSTITDSSTQVGFTLQTPNYTTMGQKLLSIKNGTNQKFLITKDDKAVAAAFEAQQLRTSGTITSLVPALANATAFMLTTEDPFTTNGQFLLKLQNGGTNVVSINHANKIEIPNGTVTIGNTQTTLDDTNERLTVNGVIRATKVKNAVYNDYQEYRSSTTKIKAGYVCVESENGFVELCKKDRQKNIQGIQSDTYGTIMGCDKEDNTPISVQGRVLVYAENKNNLKLGDQVCSSKNGKIRKMKWYEKILFPEQIVVIVSEFPSYETWGTDNVSIDGRIWINVRR